MSSRMDRYNNSSISVETPKLSRVSKNNSLYEEVKNTDLYKVKTSSNVKVLENTGKTIDINKIKRYIEENNVNHKSRRSNVIIKEPEIKSDVVIEEETKEYDINSILEKAKQNRKIDYEEERYKKLRNTDFDLLSKINLDEIRKVEKEEYNLKEELNTEERTLVDLINTITMKKEETSLLSELMGGLTSETTLPIDKEREKNILEEENDEEISKTQELVKIKNETNEIDNSFYTSSNVFSKEDFEGFDELEKNVKKNNVFSKLMLSLLVIFVIATLVIITNYVFELGLF